MVGICFEAFVILLVMRINLYFEFLFLFALLQGVERMPEARGTGLHNGTVIMQGGQKQTHGKLRHRPITYIGCLGWYNRALQCRRHGKVRQCQQRPLQTVVNNKHTL